MPEEKIEVGDEKEERKEDEEQRESRNFRMFPFGKEYALSTFGILRLLTIVICLAAFIAVQAAHCEVEKLCYESIHRYFSAISFLIFVSSLTLFILYITGIVQGLRWHPRVKAIVEGSYFGACIFFYLFACVFLIPRTGGNIEFSIASVLGVFGLILLAVHFALLMYNTNKQSAITYETRQNSSVDEETAESWVATAGTEDNPESLPTLHTIRYRGSIVEATDRPLEEITLNDSPTLPDKASTRSASSLSSSSSGSSVENSWKVVT